VYYTLNSLNIILNLYGLEIFDVSKSNIHGGSLIAYVAHKGFKNQSTRYKTLLKQDFIFLKNFENNILIFKKRINSLKLRINKFISLNKKKNNRIIGLGAPAKAITLLKVFNLTKSKIDFCLEINKKKVNTYLPNTDIIVKNQNNFRIKKNDCFILFSWNFKKSIIKNFIKNNKKKIIIFNPHTYG
jgi:NADH/NAD ratio-sensing transcriptional regulator Rex